MNTTTYSIKPLYRTKKSFLTTPSTSLYQTTDKDVLWTKSIKDLLQYTWSLEECIAGCSNLQAVGKEIKT